MSKNILKELENIIQSIKVLKPFDCTVLMITNTNIKNEYKTTAVVLCF